MSFSFVWRCFPLSKYQFESIWDNIHSGLALAIYLKSFFFNFYLHLYFFHMDFFFTIQNLKQNFCCLLTNLISISYLECHDSPWAYLNVHIFPLAFIFPLQHWIHLESISEYFLSRLKASTTAFIPFRDHNDLPLRKSSKSSSECLEIWHVFQVISLPDPFTQVETSYKCYP